MNSRISYRKSIVIAIFCNLTASLFSYAALYAQEEKKSEFSIGYGWNTTNNGVQDPLLGAVVHVFGGSIYETERSGAYYVKFQSHIAKKVLLGVYA